WIYRVSPGIFTISCRPCWACREAVASARIRNKYSVAFIGYSFLFRPEFGHCGASNCRTISALPWDHKVGPFPWAGLGIIGEVFYQIILYYWAKYAASGVCQRRRIPAAIIYIGRQGFSRIKIL